MTHFNLHFDPCGDPKRVIAGSVMVWKSLEKSLVSRKVWKSLEKSGKVWNFHHFSILSLEKSGKMIYLGQANFLFLYVWHWTRRQVTFWKLIFNFSLVLVLTNFSHFKLKKFKIFSNHGGNVDAILAILNERNSRFSLTLVEMLMQF